MRSCRGERHWRSANELLAANDAHGAPRALRLWSQRLGTTEEMPRAIESALRSQSAPQNAEGLRKCLMRLGDQPGLNRKPPEPQSEKNHALTRGTRQAP